MRLIQTVIEELGGEIRREVASLRPRALRALMWSRISGGLIWVATVGVLAFIAGIGLAVGRRYGMEVGLWTAGSIAVGFGILCHRGLIARA